MEAATGDLDAANEQYAERRSHDVDAVRDLAIAHEKMGLAAATAGDIGEARQRHRHATSIFRRLAVADSQNVQAWQSLAVSLLHEGDLEHRYGKSTEHDYQAAASKFEEALDVLRARLEIDPTNSRMMDLVGALQARILEVRAAYRARQ